MLPEDGWDEGNKDSPASFTSRESIMHMAHPWLCVKAVDGAYLMDCGA